MGTTKSGNTCREGTHIGKINNKHPDKVRTSICEDETCPYDSSICNKHFNLNIEKVGWLIRAIEWKNKKINDFGLNPTNPMLLARANDLEIIASCEDVKGHLQTQHEEIMKITPPELNIAETNVPPESTEIALVSESNNQPTMTVGNKPVIDRTGKQSNLNIALLEGDKGDAMLAVFDGGATRTAIRRELTDNGNGNGSRLGYRDNYSRSGKHSGD